MDGCGGCSCNGWVWKRHRCLGRRQQPASGGTTAPGPGPGWCALRRARLQSDPGQRSRFCSGRADALLLRAGCPRGRRAGAHLELQRELSLRRPAFHASAGGSAGGQPDGGSPPPPPPVPPYLVQGSSAAVSVATGLNPSDFGEFIRADGTMQTTFQGWPLYEFSGDSKAGDTNGDNFVGSGGPWYVIKNPFYSALAMTKSGGPAIYLADPTGRTLYVFVQDTVGTASNPPVSNCTGACLAAWPAFLAGGDAHSHWDRSVEADDLQPWRWDDAVGVRWPPALLLPERHPAGTDQRPERRRFQHRRPDQPLARRSGTPCDRPSTVEA